MAGGEFATNPRSPQFTKILCICIGTSCNITIWGTDYLMTQFQLLTFSGITCIYLSEWMMKSLFEWREREARAASRDSENRISFTTFSIVTSVKNPNGIRDFYETLEHRTLQVQNTSGSLEKLAITVQTRTGPEISRRLRLPDRHMKVRLLVLGNGQPYP
jgi:hypothetical protein